MIIVICRHCSHTDVNGGTGDGGGVHSGREKKKSFQFWLCLNKH